MSYSLLNGFYSFLFYILFFCCCWNHSAVTYGGMIRNETDRQALLAIREQIQGDPFQLFKSWNNSLHFCLWKGVTCGRNHGIRRVTSLNFSTMEMAGSFSAHAGNLSFLKVLDLSSNKFHGSIPQEIGYLKRLQVLSLANNSFNGKFPTNFTQCHDIRVFDLSMNSLLGEIPSSLGSFSKLKQLSLYKNNFTGTIPPTFGNLTSLVSLFLVENNLEGTIPFELGRLPNLEFFRVSGNNLSGILPLSIYNISTITSFDAAYNNFVGSLPQDLGFTLPKLQHVHLTNNKISGPFPASLANATRLVEFDMGENSLTGPLPLIWKNLHNLQFLLIDGNLFGNQGTNAIESVIDSLTNCTSLIELNLGYNEFGGTLPDSIGNLSSSLTKLSFSMNYITGSIPTTIGNLADLALLGLNDNSLTGIIPDSIEKLSNLHALGLFNNKLTGQIPFSIGNLTQLNVVNLFGNLLEGTIPVSFANCTSMQVLDLSFNRIVGEIPREILSLPSLSVLINLAYNHLSGKLDLQKGDLKNLGSFIISHNKIPGQIPIAFGYCLVLEILWMENNLFSGSIPSSFQHLIGIRLLDISNNKLSGSIPRFLEELSSTEVMNLSFNMFEGAVPNKGVFQNVSKFSIVGNKNLCGGIKELKLPACPKKLPERKKKYFPYKIVLPIIILAVVLLAVCFLMNRHAFRRSKQPFSLLPPHSISKYPKLSYGDLRTATNDFSSANLIGGGQYGSVYKGIFNSDHEKVVAVKVLNLQNGGAAKSFIAECEALRNIRHRNLLKIVSVCSSIDFNGNDFKALVYEFMPNGNLDRWLHPSVQGLRSLSLLERLNIAIDVASALDYLHHQCETTIIHCDLKPSNVLVDDEFCAHIGDFGLAKLVLSSKDDSQQTEASSIGIRGTVGYIPPEYGMGKSISEQGDIYSYGILILEVFTGRRPTDVMFGDSLNLRSYVEKALPDEVNVVVDPQMILKDQKASSKRSRNIQDADAATASIEYSSLVSILSLGLLCSAGLPDERMDIGNVIKGLHRIRNLFLGRSN